MIIKRKQLDEKASVLKNKIELKNLNYKYENKKILENFSYTFYKGKKYLIVGDSGKGKTTLLNIISGKINNYEGEIIWDDINYNLLDIVKIREQITYIRQDPYIFNASIKENLTLGDNFSENDIYNVLNQVGLNKWIESLPKGINTIMNLSAKNISGGQKQRIALARGLLRNSSLILLDEPTSSLDDNSAKEIEKMLFSKEDLTVIMVTHNLRDEIKDMVDEIIVI